MKRTTLLLIGIFGLLVALLIMVFRPSGQGTTPIGSAMGTAGAGKTAVASAQGGPSGSDSTASSAATGGKANPMTKGQGGFTSAGRIEPGSLSDYKVMQYPRGAPHYEGERVTAYVAVPSTGEKVALEVNQMGEYPRVRVEPGETLEVRLQFSTVPTGSKVAVAAQDGGRLDNAARSAAFEVDERRQIAFGFTASANSGIHRVHVTTEGGETKFLDVWVGPDHKMATK